MVEQLDGHLVEEGECVGRLRDVNGGASLSELSARTDGFPLPVAKLELLIQQEISNGNVARRMGVASLTYLALDGLVPNR